MIPIEQLKKIPLFSKLSIEDLARLAPLFHRHTYQVGEVVSQQGTEGDAFYVIESGRLRVRRVDAGGREQVLKYLTAPGSFGETSLFTGVHRDATVDVFSKEVTLLVLPKREFDQFLNEHPDLAAILEVHHEVKKKLDAQRIFKWLLPGEIVVVSTRRHWYSLILMLRVPAIVAVALLVLAIIASLLGWGINLVLWGLFALWLIGAGMWTGVDWSNDYYILTNRRVVHIEKVVFILDQREEAPIEQVSNVQETVTGIAARTLGFSDVHVETSGRKSDIDFTFAPSSLRIRSKIFEQMDRVRSRAAFERRERLRAGIRQDLIERLDPDALRRAQARAAAAAAAKLSEPTGVVRKKRARLAVWFEVRFGTRIDEGVRITWRKHWTILIEQAGAPFLFTVLVFLIGLLQLIGVLPLGLVDTKNPQLLALFLLIWLAVSSGGGFWTWYQYEDWRNDIYAVTDDRLVDSERDPFGFNQRAVETTLDRVQDISFAKPTIIAAILNYGDLKIETGGTQGQLVFNSIVDPQRASQEIFRRREAFRARREQQQAKQERVQFLDWFLEYNRFLQERGDIRVWADNHPGEESPAPDAPPPTSDAPPPASDAKPPADSGSGKPA